MAVEIMFATGMSVKVTAGHDEVRDAVAARTDTDLAIRSSPPLDRLPVAAIDKPRRYGATTGTAPIVIAAG